jgi:peptidyl-prolyl cis-trans isomerase SurA
MKHFVLAVVALFSLSLTAQQKDLSEEVLFTVNQEQVTAEEFMKVYNKNRNIGEDIDPKTPREYLDLYINFKLKVQNAKALGMDTMPRFVNEFNQYRNQLAKPYLSDKAVNQELIQEAYNRGLYDVRASHIMLAVTPESDAIDTLKAYKKLVALKERIEKGESFEEIAKQYSQDSYSAVKGGDLGYFTVFSMVYPFENAAYNTPVGKMSNIVRSQYGYHLVKVTDKRKARGTVQVAHIFLVDNEQSTQDQKVTAEQKIKEIYQKLQSGADFATLAKQYSEDKSSAYAGGMIPEFGINKMFPEFEEQAFALKAVGDISAPFKTPVGWHIIQLKGKPEMPSMEDMSADLKRKIDRDSRSQQGRISIIKKLKKEYGFKEYPKNIDLAFSQVGKGYLTMNYDSEGHKHGSKVMFEFEGEEYTVTDFLDWLELNQAKGGKKLAALDVELEKAYKGFSEGALLEYEKAHLEEKHPEFRMLSREYYEGILLFDLTDKKVWRKSVSDTTGLQAFFEANKSNYKWTERYEVVFVNAASKKIAKKAMKALKKGESLEEINADLNKKSLLNVQTDTGTFELKDNKHLANFTLPASGFTEIKEVDDRYEFVYVVKTIPAGPKTLEEARGSVLSDYSTYLEKEWLKELKSTYAVEVNEEVLEQVEKALE